MKKNLMVAVVGGYDVKMDRVESAWNVFGGRRNKAKWQKLEDSPEGLSALVSISATDEEIKELVDRYDEYIVNGENDLAEVSKNVSIVFTTEHWVLVGVNEAE